MSKQMHNSYYIIMQNIIDLETPNLMRNLACHPWLMSEISTSVERKNIRRVCKKKIIYVLLFLLKKIVGCCRNIFQFILTLNRSKQRLINGILKMRIVSGLTRGPCAKKLISLPRCTHYSILYQFFLELNMRGV